MFPRECLICSCNWFFCKMYYPWICYICGAYEHAQCWCWPDHMHIHALLQVQWTQTSWHLHCVDDTHWAGRGAGWSRPVVGCLQVVRATDRFLCSSKGSSALVVVVLCACFYRWGGVLVWGGWSGAHRYVWQDHQLANLNLNLKLNVNLNLNLNLYFIHTYVYWQMGRVAHE